MTDHLHTVETTPSRADVIIEARAARGWTWISTRTRKTPDGERVCFLTFRKGPQHDAA